MNELETTCQQKPFLGSLGWPLYICLSTTSCHRFRLTMCYDYFPVILSTFELTVIFEEAGTVVKIGSSLKPNHRKQI
jgi:hypothetical protein